jgi:hypothetical protein
MRIAKLSAFPELTKKTDCRLVRLAILVAAALIAGPVASQTFSGNGPAPATGATMPQLPPTVANGSISIGNANIAVSQASAGTSATIIAPIRFGRGTITVTNHGASPVYVGASNVTTANGMMLTASGTFGASITLYTQAAIYAIVATTPVTVSSFETF